MSKILAKLQKIFGGSLAAPTNIPQYGSLQAGSPTFSLDPDVIQALTNYTQGWLGAEVGTNSPTLEDMNALFFLITRQLAYLQQAGISEWVSTAIYFTGSFAQVAGIVYVSKTDNNTGNAVTDTNNWALYSAIVSNPIQQCKAWVRFNGSLTGGGAIAAQYNVASVSRDSQGRYTLTFGVAMNDANYAWSGAVGSVNGGGLTGGNNNHLCGGGNQTVNQLTVVSYEPTLTAPEDSDWVTVMIFGN